MADSKGRYVVALVAGVLAVSWAAILVRESRAPAMAIGFYRLFFASVLLLPGVIIFPQKVTQKSLNIKGLLWILPAGTSLGAHFFLWILSVKLIPIAMATLLSSTHPLFVGVMSHIFLAEPPSRGLWAGIILCLAGYSVISLPMWGSAFESQYGYLYAMGAALLFGLYLILGRGVRERLSLMEYLLPTYLTGAAFLLFMALIFRVDLGCYDARTVWMLILLALVPTLLGHSLVNLALRHLIAPMVACSILGEPVLATIWGLLLFQEWIGGAELAGAMLIIVGIVLAVKHRDHDVGSAARFAQTKY
jgi:drug/metabolite transporter (DMT)-like permease